MRNRLTISFANNNLVVPDELHCFITSKLLLEQENKKVNLDSLIYFILVHSANADVEILFDAKLSIHLISQQVEIEGINVPLFFKIWFDYYKNERDLIAIAQNYEIYLWWALLDFVNINNLKIDNLILLLTIFIGRHKLLIAWQKYYGINDFVKSVADPPGYIINSLPKCSLGDLWTKHDPYLQSYLYKKLVKLKVANCTKIASIDITLDASASINQHLNFDVNTSTLSPATLDFLCDNIESIYYDRFLIENLFILNRRCFDMDTLACSDIPLLLEGIKLKLEKQNDTIAVIGRHSTPSGVGEDARSFAKMFQNNESKLSPLVIDISKYNEEYSDSIFLDYGIELICMPPWDFLLERLKYPCLCENSRFRIGYWPWELPEVSKEFNFIFKSFDLVLANSYFVKKAFDSINFGFTDIRVLASPVDISGHENIKKIPNSKFTFLISFDMGSGFYRKNPLTAVNAFIKRFGNSNEVVLIIKTIGNIDNIQFKSLEKVILNYHNIKLIHGELSSFEYHKLLKNVDCYVSSHRSEGFGRIIAESMLLETLTITSNWSGNTDFCNPSTALLIDGKLIDVGNSYPMGENQQWFDPDTDSIIYNMEQAIYSDNASLIKNAHSNIVNNYSVESTLRKFDKILNDYI